MCARLRWLTVAVAHAPVARPLLASPGRAQELHGKPKDSRAPARRQRQGGCLPTAAARAAAGGMSQLCAHNVVPSARAPINALWLARCACARTPGSAAFIHSSPRLGARASRPLRPTLSCACPRTCQVPVVCRPCHCHHVPPPDHRPLVACHLSCCFALWAPRGRPPTRSLAVVMDGMACRGYVTMPRPCEHDGCMPLRACVGAQFHASG